jgi:hypothetical protein
MDYVRCGLSPAIAPRTTSPVDVNEELLIGARPISWLAAVPSPVICVLNANWIAQLRD